MVNEKKQTFILSVKGEGDEISVYTEWDVERPSYLIAAYVALGTRLARDLCGGGPGKAVYETLEEIFRNLQDEEFENGLLETGEECNVHERA